MAVDRAKKERDERRHKSGVKKHSLFSDEELESLVAIDECTDEELIDFFDRSDSRTRC